MIWVLIIISCSSDYRGGVSVNSVPGFKSEKLCEEARKNYSINKPSGHFESTATCTRTQ